MNPEEEGLYRQLEAMSGAPVVELAGEADGDRELTDAEVEAMIAELVRDGDEERLYSQLEAMSPSR
jgi:hypothetical protein